MDKVICQIEQLHFFEEMGLNPVPFLKSPVLPSFIFEEEIPIVLDGGEKTKVRVQYDCCSKGLRVKLRHWEGLKHHYTPRNLEFFIPFDYPTEPVEYLDDLPRIDADFDYSSHLIVCAAIQYLLQRDVDAITVEDKIAHQQKHHGKNKKKSNIIRHYKVYTLNRDYEIRHRKGKHPITVECYSVIGHERHLKNGKVVFVSPHFRGKHRDEPEKYWKGVERRLFPQNG